jgi:two-component system sensor histidine kinase RegB
MPPDDADEAMQVVALAKLRWAAVAGQLLVIAVVVRTFAVPLPLWPLFGGVAAQALFNLGVILASRRGRPLPVLAGLVADIVLLAWQLYWSGGPANPFVSLFVVPIALAATWRSVRSVVVTVVLAVVAYSALWLQHRELPHMHGDFDLHLFGMWVNFLITAAVVGFFGVRVALTMARQREALRAARERSLRDEGVLAVATLAAGAAHALNTPLSTMAVVISDLREVGGESAFANDLRILSDQVDSCRDAVRQLVAESQPDAARPALPLAERVDATVARWRLLRPSFAVACEVAPSVGGRPIAFDRGFDHLLINLLDNAADAAVAVGANRVSLSVDGNASGFWVDVRDPGQGFPAHRGPLASSKRDGPGLGLALAAMICERHGGNIRVESGGEGTRVRARLSWPAEAGSG